MFLSGPGIQRATFSVDLHPEMVKEMELSSTFAPWEKCTINLLPRITS